LVTKNTMQLTLIHWWCAKSSIGLLLSIDSSLMLVVTCKGADVVLWCIFSRNLGCLMWTVFFIGISWTDELVLESDYLLVWINIWWLELVLFLTIELDGLDGFFWYRGCWLLFGCAVRCCVVAVFVFVFCAFLCRPFILFWRLLIFVSFFFQSFIITMDLYI